MNAIECDHLSKYYGRARGIEDVTFSVEEGEVFGFIGPNGAGKSTTIRTLLGLIHASGGEARVLGRPVGLDAPELHLDLGYVPSEVNLYPEMRVAELLEYAAGFYRRPCRDRMLELAERFDLDLSRRVGALSLGNRKKVALVLALQHRPRLVILDEPTSGLDPLVQQQFAAVVREEHAAGTTIFLSSHVLGEVQELCHRVAIIREGRVLAVEGVATLRARNVKRVRVALADVRALRHLAALPGTDDFEEDGNVARFLYHGAMPALLRALAEADAQDVTIEEPSLEEVVLQYYGTEAAPDEATRGRARCEAPREASNDEAAQDAATEDATTRNRAPRYDAATSRRGHDATAEEVHPRGR